MATLQHTPEQTKKTTHPMESIMLGSLVAAMVIGVGAGIKIGEHGNADRKLAAAARTATPDELEKGLNGKKHIANKAVVEVGRVLRLPSGIGEATVVINPIKVNKDTYGYIDYQRLQKTGKVDIKEFDAADATPLNNYEGGHSKEYAHEVTTQLALVYDDAVEGTTKETHYYSVVMGNRSGDTDDMMVIAPNSDQAERDREISAQMGEIAAARVGEPVTAGK